MEKNMGTADRIARVTVAAIAGILYFTGVISGTLGIVLLVLAGVFTLTSILSCCPFYTPVRIRTVRFKTGTIPGTRRNGMNMKHLMIVVISISIGILSSTSCSKDEDNPGDITREKLEAAVKSGTWRISYFFDSEKDETQHFVGYNFTFQSNGVLTAGNGTLSYEGTWSVTTSNSDDDSQDDLDFNIQFNLTNDFEDLNDDWDIVSQSATKIELIDVSGGNGGTDYLTFEKN